MTASTQIDTAKENGGYIEALSIAVRHGGSGLDGVPKLIVDVVEHHRWQHYYDRVTQKEIDYSDFTEFARGGLNTSIAMLKRMCSDNPEAINAIDKAMQAPVGTNQYSQGDDNIHTHDKRESPTGTSADAAIRRLRNHAIDTDSGEILDPKINQLYEAVLAGEMSPNAAAIEAGFRKRMISIPADDADRAARSIRENMLPETISRLVKQLEGAY